MRNISVALKLALAFSIMLLLSAGQGGLALLRLRQVDVNVNELATNWLIGLDSLGELNGDSGDFARHNAELLLAPSDEARQKIEVIIHDKDLEVKRHLKIYEPTVTPGEEQGLYDIIVPSWKESIDNSGRLVALLQQKRSDEAKSFYHGKFIQDYTKFDNALSLAIKLNSKNANEEAAHAKLVSANAQSIVLIVVVSSIFIGLLVSVLFLRAITVPLSRLQSVLARIAHTGDLTLRAEVDSRDELGQTAQAINETLDSITVPLVRLRSVLTDIANGSNLTMRADVAGPEEIKITAKAVNKTLDAIESAFHEIRDAASQVNLLGDQINAASQTMASAAAEQSSMVEQVNANLEESDSQVRSNADAVTTANQLVAATAAEAMRSREKMAQMLGAVSAIDESSRNVAKIVKVIEEIAFQTNLLALNAAVEAARAGQHGRGFAVVAQEVRNLAGRCARAARETTELVSDSLKRAQDGVQIAGQTNTALDTIATNVAKMKLLMAGIADGSVEQSRGITQISIAITSAAKTIQESSQQAEELASSAEEMTNASASMMKEIRRFKLTERRHYLAGGSTDGLTPELLAQIRAFMAAHPEFGGKLHSQPAESDQPEVLTARAESPCLSGDAPRLTGDPPRLPGDAPDHDERGFGHF
ncbi:MAG: methyl-accepting chemotaxis protein [Rhodospirillaceae bacterium]